MKKFLVSVALLFAALSLPAQVAQLSTTGLPAPQLSGVGAPAQYFTCNTAVSGVSYIDTTPGATTGRFWLCFFNTATSLWAWQQQLGPVQGVGITPAAFPAATYLLGGCTGVQTVAIAGATMGVNSATASPIFSTMPGGNFGLLHVTAIVSSPGVFSVQACAFGALTSVPAFTVKVVMN